MKMIKRLSIIFMFYPYLSISSQNIDIRLLRSFNSTIQLPSDNFFRFISDSEPYIIAGIPIYMGSAGLVKHNDSMFRNACVTAAATVICAGITNALKYSINRDRPFVTYPDITKKTKAGSPSFPSGHTSSAFASATSLSLAYSKWYVIVPSYTWAGTVAYSRMHLGVHYPSDVLLGALVGAGSSWLTYKINLRMMNPNKGKQ